MDLEKKMEFVGMLNGKRIVFSEDKNKLGYVSIIPQFLFVKENETFSKIKVFWTAYFSLDPIYQPSTLIGSGTFIIDFDEFETLDDLIEVVKNKISSISKDDNTIAILGNVITIS